MVCLLIQIPSDIAIAVKTDEVIVHAHSVQYNNVLAMATDHVMRTTGEQALAITGRRSNSMTGMATLYPRARRDRAVDLCARHGTAPSRRRPLCSRGARVHSRQGYDAAVRFLAGHARGMRH